MFIVNFDKQALKEAVGEVFDEKNATTELNTIIMSEASQMKFDSLIQRMGLNIIEEEVPVIDHSVEFERFNWNGESEPEGTPRARTHLEIELRKFGCQFGRSGYKLVDVHTKNNLLNIKDTKIGKLSGGSDVVIVPYKTALSGIKNQICVLFELKTEENVRVHGLDSFSCQAKLELVAGWSLSHQRVMVVLTDLVSDCLVYELTYSEVNINYDLLEYHASLCEMGRLVERFLSVQAIPDAGFVAHDSENPHHKAKVRFKRMKMSGDAALDDYLEFDRYFPFEPTDAMLSPPFSSNYSHMYS